MLTDLQEVAQLRLENGWTYARLGQEIGLPEPTIRRVLTVRNPRMHETTWFKIRRFLKEYRSSKPPRRRRRAADRQVSA